LNIAIGEEPVRKTVRIKTKEKLMGEIQRTELEGKKPFRKKGSQKGA